MGEILSTVDLIMQRTQGMALSDAEKKILRLEELGKKAKGFYLKILGNSAILGEILASIDRDGEEDGRIIKSMIWNDMVKNMPTGQNLLNHLSIMEKLPQAQEKSQWLHDLRAKLQASTKNRSKEMKSIFNAERKKLAAFGISGSAVIPKVALDSWFDDNLANIVDYYKEKLYYHSI